MTRRFDIVLRGLWLGPDIGCGWYSSGTAQKKPHEMRKNLLITRNGPPPDVAPPLGTVPKVGWMTVSDTDMTPI